MKRRVIAIAAVVASVVGGGLAWASDDPDFSSEQYGPQQIYAPEAWTVTRGEGVTIAIVDTGVQLDHPEFRGKLVPGYDFADNDDDPNDEVGHGTHVAGIAAAVTDNGIGIAGVAPDSKIMPLRVPLIGSTGSANIAEDILAVEEAIRFAVSNGAQVINLSIGGEEPLTPQGFDNISTACVDAFNSGALCIAAAGNGGQGKPSGYSHDFQGIVVAATDREKDVADFSQRADTQWSVAAPGVAIYSAWLDSSFQYNQGTSMAAPHVAGVAGLLFSMDMNVQQVVDRIMATAVPLNDGGGTTGAGLVNAAGAVGAEYTVATTAPRAATTTTVATGSAPSRPSGPATTIAVDQPVVLEEGVIEADEGDLLSGSESDFEVALGEDPGPEPIGETDGFTASFLLLTGVFIGVSGVLGFVLRRVVLRRGIGEIHGKGIA